MKPHRSFWELFGELPAPTRPESGSGETADPSDPSGGASEGTRRDQHSPCACFFSEDHVYWALRNMPIQEAVKHFLICGAVGSGKTTAIELFLQSIAPRFAPDRSPPEQLIVFDAKRDILPTLAALGLRPEDEHVWILNPFDRRSAVWSLAAAARTQAMSRYIGSLLVPEERQSNAPYFAAAAQKLVTYTIWGLNRIAGARWSFRDLLCALESRETIRWITARHLRAGPLAAAILDDTKHAFGVLSTLSTQLSRFEEVAALWHSRPDARQFSVEAFLQRPGVLVLGYDPVLKESLAPINALLLKALTDEILHRDNTLRPRHWFVLDEFRAMENVEAIHDLLNRGRSKGAAVMIGLQSIEGLRDVYPEHRAEDILSACAHKIFLRAGDPKTARWAEEYVGQVRRFERVVTETYGRDSSTSIQHGLQDRSTLLASYFLSLPFTGPGKPYKAVCDLPWLDLTVIAERPFDQLHRWRRPPDAEVEAFKSHPRPEDEVLQAWTREERAYYRKGTGKSKKRRTARSKAPKTRPAVELPTRSVPDQSGQLGLALNNPPA